MTLAVFSVDIFSAQSEREAPYTRWLETENVSKSYSRSVDFSSINNLLQYCRLGTIVFWLM